MKEAFLKILKKIILHLLFWVAVWFFFIYLFSYNSNNRNYSIWFSSNTLPLTITITYYLIYYLIPKFLLTKKYWQFALHIFYSLIFSTNIIVPLIIMSFIFKSNYNLSHMPPMSRNMVFILIMVYLVAGLVSFIHLLKENFNTISRNKELQNKILETQLKLKEQELEYLKMQIHPHFLFNTLNTIYGLAIKQSKYTPKIILMLSNLLDYILYQVNKPIVNLKEELLHIKEYIDLERIRFQDTLKVVYKSDDIDDRIQIAPMLLIPFVENAFKHGSIVNGYLSIVVNVTLNQSQFDFKISNTINDDNIDSKVGIGLNNIKKRLDLNYKDNYGLNIEKEENWYKIKLTILDINKIKNER